MFGSSAGPVDNSHAIGSATTGSALMAAARRGGLRPAGQIEPLVERMDGGYPHHAASTGSPAPGPTASWRTPSPSGSSACSTASPAG
ncbi:hypothetical protein [Actinoplanes siamensis]|uniref:Uncharacterized protein n=1 Tax=Actinoplanes siamensis TaxID=1223317 RepID=A0A919N8Q3_9ACTN|nr:hypothetical protein [Actinoplanes siamensis]GIF06329.1 hypothetical protein Asi03nite_38670 [Actinoplanes siamensis]